MINGSGCECNQVISYRNPVGDIIGGEISDTIIRTLVTLTRNLKVKLIPGLLGQRRKIMQQRLGPGLGELEGGRTGYGTFIEVVSPKPTQAVTSPDWIH